MPRGESRALVDRRLKGRPKPVRPVGIGERPAPPRQELDTVEGMTPTEQAVPILPAKGPPAGPRVLSGPWVRGRGAPPQEWGYCILGRGDIWLHLIADPAVDPLTTASSCYLFVDDAQGLHDTWAPLVTHDPTTGQRIVAPAITDYGMLEFALIDPSGNLLRIGTHMPDRAT